MHVFMKKHTVVFLLVLLSGGICFAQTANPVQVKAYVSTVHPLVTLDRTGATYNFKSSYTIGFPVGINLYHRDTSLVGLSFEFIPFIKVEKGSDKMSNLLFHPGVVFRIRPRKVKEQVRFSIIGRGAFETSGRYGFTPNFSLFFQRKAADKKKPKFFVAVPVPVRFGAGKPASVNLSFQFGIVF